MNATKPIKFTSPMQILRGYYKKGVDLLHIENDIHIDIAVYIICVLARNPILCYHVYFNSYYVIAIIIIYVDNIYIYIYIYMYIYII